MVDFSNEERYKRYNEKFLYSSYVRSILQGTDVRNNDLLSMHISFSHSYGYTACFHDSCIEYPAEKAELYSLIAMLYYIPYGKAGYEYLQSKIGSQPLWEFQYQKAMNILSADNAFFDKEEKSEIKELFRRLNDDTQKLDFIGFTLIVLHAYMNCFLTKAGLGEYDEYVGKIYTDAEEKGLTEIKLSDYLPKVEEAPLDEDKIALIEEMIEERNLPSVYEIELTKEEYSKICRGANKLVTKDIARLSIPGDNLKLCWDCLVLDGYIESVEEATPEMLAALGADALVLPEPHLSEKPVIITFRKARMARESRGNYHLDYDSSDTGEIGKNDKFYVVLIDEKVYEPIYMYPRFVLRDISTGKRLVAWGSGGAIKTHSKEELLSKMTESEISSVSKSAIEAGAITPADFACGVLIVYCTCYEKE